MNDGSSCTTAGSSLLLNHSTFTPSISILQVVLGCWLGAGGRVPCA